MGGANAMTLKMEAVEKMMKDPLQKPTVSFDTLSPFQSFRWLLNDEQALTAWGRDVLQSSGFPGR